MTNSRFAVSPERWSIIEWRMADADESLKGREIFLDEMAQVVAEGYSPSERLKRTLELMGVTYGT